jgi:serine/threonine protein kinase
MPAPTAVPEFLSLVRESGLWDESRYHEVAGQANDLPADPAATAERLIEHGYLTRFQARQLLLGKHRGFVLGSYRLLEPIPVKSGGTHYLAEHVGLRRRVVIKMLPHAQAAEKPALERFFREARAVAALDHKNILRLHDIGVANSAHFLVLEYAQGEDLQTRLTRDGALPPGLAAWVGLQAAEGLKQAHDRGIVHRDLRPANLFLTDSGVLKVRGMGLARSIEVADDDITKLLGNGDSDGSSADYSAPEYAAGDAVDARCDVFGIGATLYGLINGAPPYSGSIAHVLMQHQAGEAPPLVGVVRATPPGLSDAVAAMMRRHAADRPASMAEVADLLRPFAQAPAKPTKPVAVEMQTPPPRPGQRSSQFLTTRPAPPPPKPQLDGRRIAAAVMLALTAAFLAAAGLRLLL